MTKYILASIALFISGLVLFLAGILTGDTKVFLAVIIPVIQTSNPLSIIGILLMFSSFIIYMFGRFRGADYERTTSKAKTGGIILIGPIPIVFSNDRDLAKILMVLAVIAVVFILLFIIFFL